MRILPLTVAVAALAACGNANERVHVYPITCKIAGKAVADGFAQRDGVVRQTYRDRESGALRKLTLIPGTQCERGDYLLRSEWDEIKREWAS